MNEVGPEARVRKSCTARTSSWLIAIERMRAAAAKIEPMLAVVDQINQRLARGEGTLGRLSRDPEFPEDAKELGKILKRQPWRIFGRPND